MWGLVNAGLNYVPLSEGSKAWGMNICFVLLRELGSLGSLFRSNNLLVCSLVHMLVC